MNESGGSKNIEKRQRRQLQRSGLDNCQDYSRPEARQNYGMNEDWGSTVRRGSKLIEERTRVRLGRRGSKPSIIRDCSGSKNDRNGIFTCPSTDSYEKFHSQCTLALSIRTKNLLRPADTSPSPSHLPGSLILLFLSVHLFSLATSEGCMLGVCWTGPALLSIT